MQDPQRRKQQYALDLQSQIAGREEARRREREAALRQSVQLLQLRTAAPSVLPTGAPAPAPGAQAWSGQRQGSMRGLDLPAWQRGYAGGPAAGPAPWQTQQQQQQHQYHQHQQEVQQRQQPLDDQYAPSAPMAPPSWEADPGMPPGGMPGGRHSEGWPRPQGPPARYQSEEYQQGAHTQPMGMPAQPPAWHVPSAAATAPFGTDLQQQQPVGGRRRSGLGAGTARGPSFSFPQGATPAANLAPAHSTPPWAGGGAGASLTPAGPPAGPGAEWGGQGAATGGGDPSSQRKAAYRAELEAQIRGREVLRRQASCSHCGFVGFGSCESHRMAPS